MKRFDRGYSLRGAQAAHYRLSGPAVLLLLGLAVGGALMAGSVHAQTMPQQDRTRPADRMSEGEMPGMSGAADVQKLANAYRVSKIDDMNVVNDANENIGKIDDVVISSDEEKAPYAIISVGGFLGMGTRLVAVPFENLRIANNRIMLPGATRDELKRMPEFRYGGNTMR